MRFRRWPFLFLAMILPAACGEPRHHSPEIMEHPNRHFVEAGSKYLLEFAEPVDDHPVNEVWTGAELMGSPLSYMTRSPVIFKADDLGGAIGVNAARFVELADSYGAIVSLGIVTSWLTDRARVNRTYSDLHSLGFEAWFHGHRHDWSPPTAEFSGVGAHEQQESFETGIELGRKKLGVEFHSFGAPGNAVDDNTAAAMVAFPQMVVWLFGKSGAPSLQGTDVWVLRRALEFEESVGTVRAPDEFVDDLDRVIAAQPPPEVLTLQVHPRKFGQDDFERSDAILSTLIAKDMFRFTSPFEEWKWRMDRDNIVLTKVDPSTYVLDLSAADFDHWITMDPSAPLPATFERSTD